LLRKARKFKFKIRKEFWGGFGGKRAFDAILSLNTSPIFVVLDVWKRVKICEKFSEKFGWKRARFEGAELAGNARSFWEETIEILENFKQQARHKKYEKFQTLFVVKFPT
jgi:hypothetical protein